MIFDEIFQSNKQEEFKSQIEDLPVTEEQLSSLIGKFSDFYRKAKERYNNRSESDRDRIKFIVKSEIINKYKKRSQLIYFMDKYIDTIEMAYLIEKMETYLDVRNPLAYDEGYDGSGYEFIDIESEDFLRPVFSYYTQILNSLIELKRIKFY